MAPCRRTGLAIFPHDGGHSGTQVIARAKDRLFDNPRRLQFDLSAHPGVLADVEPLRGAGGWLRVAKLRIEAAAITREHLVLSVVSDNGQPTHHETIERLLVVPAHDLGPPVSAAPDDELTSVEAERRASLLALAEEQNDTWLEEENEKLDAYADDLEHAFEAEVKALELEIKAAKKALRGSHLR